MAKVLDTHHLTGVGGFTPVLMHQPGNDPLPEIDRILAGYDATGAKTLVLSAVSGLDGYDSRPELDADGWALLLRNLDRISARAAEHGVRAVLHPHVGTMVETGDDVQRVLEGSGDVAVPGHRAPADRRHRPGRAHPSGPRTGSPTPTSRTSTTPSRPRSAPAGPDLLRRRSAQGMYRPLGTGDVDVASDRQHLAGNGYTGWFTLEQDTILTEEPRPAPGPIDNARISADYVRSLLHLIDIRIRNHPRLRNQHGFAHATEGRPTWSHCASASSALRESRSWP